jgi:flagellar hook-basal body complex protein FliE
MMIAPVEAIQLAPLASPEIELGHGSEVGQGFAQMVGQGVSELNHSLNEADSSVRAYAAGEDVSVPDLMVSMGHVRLQLQFAVEVRNRIIDAYQSLTNMQI